MTIWSYVPRYSQNLFVTQKASVYTYQKGWQAFRVLGGKGGKQTLVSQLFSPTNCHPESQLPWRPNGNHASCKVCPKAKILEKSQAESVPVMEDPELGSKTKELIRKKTIQEYICPSTLTYIKEVPPLRVRPHLTQLSEVQNIVSQKCTEFTEPINVTV